MKILGLDISTTTIGICVLEKLDNNYSIIYCSYFKPPKNKETFETLKETKDYIIDIIRKYKPDLIAIEDFILFMKGASGAKTITKLSVINRMVGLACYEETGKVPELYSVLQIRHGIRRKINAKSLPAKEELPDILSLKLDIQIPLEYKKNGSLKTEVYDMSDATCCAYHCAELKC